VAGREQQMLELGLRDLEERLLAGLAGELLELRAAARGLRDLDLGAPRRTVRVLVEDSRFFDLLIKSVGWSELVSDTIRRHLAGALARRRRLSSWWLRRID
jgi:hypothetical protein